MIAGGSLNKADYTELLAKTLSSNAGKPLSEAFIKLAETHVKNGMYDDYRKTIEKLKKAKK